MCHSNEVFGLSIEIYRHACVCLSWYVHTASFDGLEARKTNRKFLFSLIFLILHDLLTDSHRL